MSFSDDTLDPSNEEELRTKRQLKEAVGLVHELVDAAMEFLIPTPGYDARHRMEYVIGRALRWLGGERRPKTLCELGYHQYEQGSTGLSHNDPLTARTCKRCHYTHYT